MQYYPDELYHFGVKGMKWGVRRNRRSTPEQRASKQERMRKARKIAARAAGLAIIGAGIYAQHQSGKRIIDSSNRIARTHLGREFTADELSNLHRANRRRTARTIARTGIGLSALAYSEKLRKQSYESKNGLDAVQKRRASRTAGIAGALSAPAIATLPYAAYRYRDEDRRFKESISQKNSRTKRKRKKKKQE